MSCSMSSGADGAPEKPQKASRDGNIRRESAVPIEERNLTPEVVEQRAGAESERQRTILPEAHNATIAQRRLQHHRQAA
jgi:hypothetical protein